MTETSLYKRTLIVLGATILVPLIAVSVSAANSGAVVTPFQSYLTTTSSSATTTVTTPTVTTPETGQTSSTQTTVPSQSTPEASQPTASAPTVSTDNVQTTGAKPAGTYTVKDGDTYGCIAENYYGSYDQWSRVFNANAGGAGYGEYDLAVGGGLTLPAVNAEEALPKTILCE